MKSKSRLRAVLAGALPLFLLTVSACSVPDMQVSQSFAEKATVLPVEGRPLVRMSIGKEKGFQFGQYQLRDIQRGWTRKTEPDAFWLKVSDAYQKYTFAVKDTARQKTWPVQAAALHSSTALEAEGLSISLDKQREFLQAEFTSPESGVWQLALADPGTYIERVHFKGSLANGKEEIEVRPLYKWQSKSLPSSTNLGYEFSVNGEVLATVQTVNSGKVWLKQGLSPDLQMVLASASGSLLLYDKLGEEK